MKAKLRRVGFNELLGGAPGGYAASGDCSPFMLLPASANSMHTRQLMT
jgi:hypothetical protein